MFENEDYATHFCFGVHSAAKILVSSSLTFRRNITSIRARSTRVFTRVGSLTITCPILPYFIAVIGFAVYGPTL